MYISSDFDRANQKRREHKMKLDLNMAKKLNDKLKYFKKRIENEPSFANYDRANLLKQVFDGIQMPV